MLRKRGFLSLVIMTPLVMALRMYCHPSLALRKIGVKQLGLPACQSKIHHWPHASQACCQSRLTQLACMILRVRRISHRCWEAQR